jgi:hypothetical protein
MRPALRLLPLLLVLALPDPAPAAPRMATHADLVTFFQAWRAFQKPRRVDGVPDYSVAAMAAQQRELLGYQARLKELDPAAWSIPQQVDYQVVRAELAGMEFDHRVLRPWANDPAFYAVVSWDQSDQPAREGPLADGAVELWALEFPLSPRAAGELEASLKRLPGLLGQARSTLVGNGRDLWIHGVKALRVQTEDLGTLLTRLGAPDAVAAAPDAGSPGPGPAPLLEAARKAQAASEALVTWVESKLPQKTGSAAVGMANYDWYLRHVQLVPSTWREEVALMERELARAGTLLAMEEHRNRKLPPQVPIASQAEHDAKFPEAVTRYLAFLKDHDLLSLPPHLEPALRARLGRFRPGPREFFSEVDDRDPMVLRTHGYHWFDLARMQHQPHPDPIRRGPLLYNIFNTRTEGHATAWEELMLQAGMFDDRPRSRELVAILLAERAARALAGLKMISGEYTLEEAAAFAAAHTPRGWLSLKGGLVREEQLLYLRQPGYGTCYLTGKIQLEKLLATRREQLGEAFDFHRHLDALDAAGLIPASLLRWELTGQLPDEVRRMLAEK